jgi:hypothetical protein
VLRQTFARLLPVPPARPEHKHPLGEVLYRQGLWPNHPKRTRNPVEPVSLTQHYWLCEGPHPFSLYVRRPG